MRLARAPMRWAALPITKRLSLRCFVAVAKIAHSSKYDESTISKNNWIIKRNHLAQNELVWSICWVYGTDLFDDKETVIHGAAQPVRIKTASV